MNINLFSKTPSKKISLRIVTMINFINQELQNLYIHNNDGCGKIWHNLCPIIVVTFSIWNSYANITIWDRSSIS